MSTLLHFSVHGKVIASFKCKDATSYILLVEVEQDEWATCVLRSAEATEWVWGHYTKDYKEAIIDFSDRILRGY